LSVSSADRSARGFALCGRDLQPEPLTPIRILALAVTLFVAGCTSLFQDVGGRQRQGVSGSLVDFLYPKGEVPPPQDKVVPKLDLPVRVGLAFVPARHPSAPGLSEASKNELLGRVKAAFADREFIRDITVMPDTYLRGRSGFESIDQVARLYGLDVVTLVSYDQVTHSEDTRWSILYWTIVGAYVVKGSKNDVQTFVDAAVFDVKTRKLLFRAPGIDRVESTSTLINSPEQTRKGARTQFHQRDGRHDRQPGQGAGSVSRAHQTRQERDRHAGAGRFARRRRGGRSGGAGAAALRMRTRRARRARPLTVVVPG
jgi:rhombotail lipoprotein